MNRNRKRQARKKQWKAPMVVMERSLVANAEGPDQMRGSIPTDNPDKSVGDPFIAPLMNSHE